MCCLPQVSPYAYLAAKTLSEDEALTALFLNAIWQGKGNYTFDADYALSTADTLLQGFVKGYKVGGKTKPTDKAVQLAAVIPDIDIDFNSADWGVIQAMRLNTYRFSAAKSMDMARELNALLPTSPTFADFKKQAAPIIGQYNVNYLRTEYDNAYATAQNTARYYDLQRVKDVYGSWRYMTVGDGRVRPAHRALQGRIFKADDPAFDAIYPPNGHGCRCYVEAVADEPNTTKEQAIELLQNEPAHGDKSTWDVMVEQGYNQNPAKTGTIYANNRAYFKDFNPDAALNFKGYNLKPAAEIMPAEKLPTVERTRSQAKQFIKSNYPDGKIPDYAGIPVDYTKSLSKHLRGSLYTQKRKLQNYIELLPEVLQNPDEVWMYMRSEIHYRLNYVKLYDGKAFLVQVKVGNFEGNGIECLLETWVELPGDKLTIDDVREGILLKK